MEGKIAMQDEPLICDYCGEEIEALDIITADAPFIYHQICKIKLDHLTSTKPTTNEPNNSDAAANRER